MIAKKISQSANFKNSVCYILRQGRYADQPPPLLTGSMNLADCETQAHRLAWEMHRTFLYADTLKELAGVPKKHRKKCKLPVLHRMFSYGDYVPTADEIRRDVASHVKALGLEAHEIVWAAHNDTGKLHVHLIINKIDPHTGLTVKLDDDYAKADAWRAAWDAAHSIAPANDNPNRPPSAAHRGEWEERRFIDRETFAQAARQLHKELNQEQAAELKAFCKAKAAEWLATASERTRHISKETWSRAYREDRYFSTPKRQFVPGYHTTETVVKVGRNGRLYMRPRRRWIRGYVRHDYPSFWERWAWVKLNRHRFQAAGIEPPMFWQAAFMGMFLASLRELHAAEKAKAKQARAAARKDIIANLKAGALADLKQGHRAAHDTITREQIRARATQLLMARVPAKPKPKRVATVPRKTFTANTVLMAKPKPKPYRPGNKPGD